MASRTLFVLASLLTLLACETTQENTGSLSYATEAAPEWTNLFKRTSGWFGGDGVFVLHSITQGKPDRSKQLILFSDTMVGEIKDSILQEDFHMVNNSVVNLVGDRAVESAIDFPMHHNGEGKEVSIFPVKLDGTSSKEYFWLGDGFVHPTSGKTYIFAYRVIDHPEWTDQLFKFEIAGGALIVLPKDSQFPYEDQYQLEVPFFKGADEGNISFGAGIFEHLHGADADGYIYIYGVRDPGKELLVARIKPDEIESFDQWRFYSDDGWDGDFTQAVAVCDSASNELSVSPLPNGQFALIFQINGIDKHVGMRLGSSPIGPFDNVHRIWDCSPDLLEKEWFAYNAKAHPSISQPGELLISYNINSFAFWDQINDHPQLYRPRFIRLKFK